MAQKREVLALAVMVIGVVLFLTAFHVGPEVTEHEYTVKTEQVETDAGYQGSATPVEELTSDERRALQTAFRNTDGFLDGASAYIETEEKLNLNQTTEWMVVEVNGVHLLTVIQHTDTTTYHRGTPLNIGLAVVGLLIFFLGCVKLLDV